METLETLEEVKRDETLIGTSVDTLMQQVDSPLFVKDEPKVQLAKVRDDLPVHGGSDQGGITVVDVTAAVKRKKCISEIELDGLVAGVQLYTDDSQKIKEHACADLREILLEKFGDKLCGFKEAAYLWEHPEKIAPGWRGREIIFLRDILHPQDTEVIVKLDCTSEKPGLKPLLLTDKVLDEPTAIFEHVFSEKR